MHPNLKKCTKCNQEKPATKDFFNRRSDSNKFRNECKSCVNAYAKKYHQENLEKVKAYWKKYRQENHEKEKTRLKKYREANREKLKASSKKYYETNPDKVKASHKKHYEANREKISAHQKKYYQANPEQKLAKWKKHDEKKLAKFADGYNLTKREIKHALMAWSNKIRKNPCAICGKKAQHAHHILYATNYPKLLLNLNNGVPLCVYHHAEVHLFDSFAHLIKMSTP